MANNLPPRPCYRLGAKNFGRFFRARNVLIVVFVVLRRAKKRCAFLMKQEQNERFKRIEWNNVSLVVDVAIMSVAISRDSSRLIFVFIKARFASLAHLTNMLLDVPEVQESEVLCPHFVRLVELWVIQDPPPNHVHRLLELHYGDF